MACEIDQVGPGRIDHLPAGLLDDPPERGETFVVINLDVYRRGLVAFDPEDDGVRSAAEAAEPALKDRAWKELHDPRRHLGPRPERLVRLRDVAVRKMDEQYTHRSSYRTKKRARVPAVLQKQAEAGKTVRGRVAAA
jgi:hypothetical protein